MSLLENLWVQWGDKFLITIVVTMLYAFYDVSHQHETPLLNFEQEIKSYMTKGTFSQETSLKDHLLDWLNIPVWTILFYLMLCSLFE